MGAQEIYDGKYNRKDLTLKNYTNDNYDELTIKHLPKNYKEIIDMNDVDGEMMSCGMFDKSALEDNDDGDVDNIRDESYTSDKDQIIPSKYHKNKRGSEQSPILKMKDDMRKK